MGLFQGEEASRSGADAGEIDPVVRQQIRRETRLVGLRAVEGALGGVVDREGEILVGGGAGFGTVGLALCRPARERQFRIPRDHDVLLVIDLGIAGGGQIETDDIDRGARPLVPRREAVDRIRSHGAPLERDRIGGEVPSLVGREHRGRGIEGEPRTAVLVLEAFGTLHRERRAILSVVDAEVVAEDLGPDRERRGIVDRQTERGELIRVDAEVRVRFDTGAVGDLGRVDDDAETVVPVGAAGATRAHVGGTTEHEIDGEVPAAPPGGGGHAEDDPEEGVRAGVVRHIHADADRISVVGIGGAGDRGGEAAVFLDEEFRNADRHGCGRETDVAHHDTQHHGQADGEKWMLPPSPRRWRSWWTQGIHDGILSWFPGMLPGAWRPAFPFPGNPSPSLVARRGAEENRPSRSTPLPTTRKSPFLPGMIIAQRGKLFTRFRRDRSLKPDRNFCAIHSPAPCRHPREGSWGILERRCRHVQEASCGASRGALERRGGFELQKRLDKRLSFSYHFEKRDEASSDLEPSPSPKPQGRTTKKPQGRTTKSLSRTDQQISARQSSRVLHGHRGVSARCSLLRT